MLINRTLPRLAVGWAAFLSLIQVAQADLIALKRDAGLVHADPLGTGNSDASVLHATFQALGPGDVVLTTVKDTAINYGNVAVHPWKNYGVTVSYGSSMYSLFEFDLNTAPGLRGGTVIRAELRLYWGGTGNTGYQVGRTLTSWSEGNKDDSYPGLAPSAPGASLRHPHGLNTAPNQLADGTTGSTGSWQSGSFSATGATGETGLGLDGDMARSRKTGSNNRWHVYDVTAIAQSWSDGVANHGFWYRNANYGIRYSEAGTERQPVLFIEYTSAIAKGTTILFR